MVLVWDALYTVDQQEDKLFVMADIKCNTMFE